MGNRHVFGGDVQANKPSHKSTRVVIVDDDSELLGELCDLVENDICDVVAFSSPLSALRYLNCHQTDILISDYQMPTLDGVQLAHMALEICPETLIIIISGLPLDSHTIQKTWHLLKKPFDIRQLKIYIQARAKRSV